MATELYAITVPALIRGFASLSAILEKGRAWADENGVAHDELLGARLHADMGPLTMQVQRASDTAKNAAARLGRIEAPAMPDTEASFAELQDRIARTVAFLETVPAEAIDGREDAEIVVTTPGRSFTFNGSSYVATFVLPNFYFHVTTAYAILRMKGVPLGKTDYLGEL